MFYQSYLDTTLLTLDTRKGNWMEGLFARHDLLPMSLQYSVQTPYFPAPIVKSAPGPTEWKKEVTRFIMSSNFRKHAKNLSLVLVNLLLQVFHQAYSANIWFRSYFLATALIFQSISLTKETRVNKMPKKHI